MKGRCPLCGSGPFANLGQHFRWTHRQTLKAHLATVAPKCGGCGNAITHHAVRGPADYIMKRRYCSAACSNGTRLGTAHPRFRGGFIDEKGYRIICVRGRRIQEHRAVMEKALGRRLLTEEHVHHKNGDKLDNRLENLEVLSVADHARLHAQQKH